MSQLGKLNFTDLARYLVRASDLDTQQNYFLDFLKESQIGLRSPGVIYGCEVTVVSALTVQISAGLVLFPNGQLVAVAAQSITLGAANASNPRIDRIELSPQVANGSNVSTIDGVVVVLSKNFNGSLFVNGGTASATPSANPTTSGNVSLAAVAVAALQTTLVTGNILPTDDTYRDISAFKFGATGAQRLRWNTAKARFEISEDGTTYLAIGRKVVEDIYQSVLNNQASPVNVVGLSFDATKTIGAKMLVEVVLQSDTPAELVEMGEMFAIWRPKSALWELSYVSNFDETGVVFSIATTGTAGQVKYTSPNTSGANYVGKLRISSIVLQPV